MAYLDVSPIHEIHYEVHGNPKGIPLVTLHGGPGAGSSPNLPDLFNLDDYYLVVFDQRGAGHSRPHAEMRENTTQDLIADMEKLREHLGIDQWALFGGSWGSLLAILYGEAYPERCLGFILRGIFLGRAEDLRLGDLVEKYYDRVMDPDPDVHLEAARGFMRDRLASVRQQMEIDDQQALGIARGSLHYSAHRLFIEEGQALGSLDRIAHLPAILVHGCNDENTLPKQALLLHDQWPGSALWMVEGGGHMESDPAISAALRKAACTLIKRFR